MFSQGISKMKTIVYVVGGVCNLVISVDLLSKLFPPQIQHKTLQSRKRNGIEHNEH